MLDPARTLSLKSQHDTRRKSNLLKSLKTTFESLMFDGCNKYSNSFLNGNQILFCKNIIEILFDGLIVSIQSQPSDILLDLIKSTLLDNSTIELNSPKKQFKLIYETIECTDAYTFLTNWILNSLRNQTFLIQIYFVFKNDLFKQNYNENAFILDADFAHDFLVYIKAYEHNNFKILKECKLDLYKLLNSQVDLSVLTDSINLSFSSSPHATKSSRISHVRNYSYPVVQMKYYNINENESIEQNSKKDDLSDGILIENFLDDREHDRESPIEEHDPILDANIFDFIKELQINSECSPLDKENSHFLMADLAITSAELIKTQILKEKKISKTTSSPINIVKKASNVPKNNFSPNRSQSFSKSFNSAIYKSLLLKRRRSSSLSDLYSVNLDELFSEFKELRLNKISDANTSFNKFSSDSSYTQLSKLSTSLNISECSFNINEEGFDMIIDSKTRARRFSWEADETFDSAGSIATRLITNLLNETNLKAPPVLRDYDFFLKYMEYEELIRDFYSNFNFKTNKKKLLFDEKSQNLSASSIYLSHLDSVPSDNLSRLSISPVSFIDWDIPQSSSSYYSIKSAALNAGLKRQNGEITLDSSASSTGRIIGDESWAPVREQLILSFNWKIKRNDQIKLQHFRCADCGIQIKDMNKQTNKFNYCEYFGKYFCRCCHINQTSYIPAYIVNLLDFRISFKVSKKAKNFLDKIYQEPTITLESLNPQLFLDKSNVFSKIKKMRLKLNYCKSYIDTCRYARQLASDLNSKFEDFMIKDTQVYSIESLFKIKKTNYYEQMKFFFLRVAEHIYSCELCSQKGYICGICDKKDLLYPFELEKVDKCPNCLACYHRSCFKKPDNCPRCIRLKSRANNK